MSLVIAMLLWIGFQQEQLPVEIRADQFEYEGNVQRAIGNVRILYQDIILDADRVDRDQSTQQVTATGRVRFTRGDEILESGSVTINLLSKAGTLSQVKGNLGPGYFISAEEAERTESGMYRLKNATVTTCEGPDAGWTFAAARFDIDPRKSVRARGSTFRLEGIPVFYLPYVVVPSSDRSRSTGFLIPVTGSSTTKGRTIRQPFFWAINRSADLMLTGEYFTKRGPTIGADFRVVPNDRSSVVINTFFARDRLGQGGQSGRVFGFTQFGQGNRVVADINFVSSFEFRQVYGDGLNAITFPINPSLAYLTRNRPEASLNILYNRTSVFFTEQSSVVLKKAPAFEFVVPERRVGRLPVPVYFTLESGASGVARRDAAIDSPRVAGRFDVNPAIEIPLLRSSAFDWSHRVGIRETFYTHSVDNQVQGDPLNRLSFHYTSRFVGPQIERDFGSFKHVLEPGIDYRFVGGVDRFRRTMVVDDVDLLTNTNEIEYSLTNRLFGTYEFFAWRLSQRYFFDPTFGGAILRGRRNVFTPLLDFTGFAFADGRRFSPIVSTMRISTSPSSSAELQVDYDTRNRLFRAAGINGGLSHGAAFGSVAYFFTRRSTTHEANNQLRTTIGFGDSLRPGFSAALNLSYDIERTLFQGTVAQVGYNTDCYGLSLEFVQVDIGPRKESRIRFAFSLKNIGSIGTLGRQERLF